jgi:hypothetical protein
MRPVHQHTHDMMQVEEWITDLLQSQQPAHCSLPQTYRDMASGYSICFNELVKQAQAHSPLLSLLLEKVGRAQSDLFNRLLNVYEGRDADIHALEQRMLRVVKGAEQKRNDEEAQSAATKFQTTIMQTGLREITAEAEALSEQVQAYDDEIQRLRHVVHTTVDTSFEHSTQLAATTTAQQHISSDKELGRILIQLNREESKQTDAMKAMSQLMRGLRIEDFSKCSERSYQADRSHKSIQTTWMLDAANDSSADDANDSNMYIRVSAPNRVISTQAVFKVKYEHICMSLASIHIEVYLQCSHHLLVLILLFPAICLQAGECPSVFLQRYNLVPAKQLPSAYHMMKTCLDMYLDKSSTQAIEASRRKCSGIEDALPEIMLTYFEVRSLCNHMLDCCASG